MSLRLRLCLRVTLRSSIFIVSESLLSIRSHKEIYSRLTQSPSSGMRLTEMMRLRVAISYRKKLISTGWNKRNDSFCFRKENLLREMTKSYTYCLKVPFSESVVSNFLSRAHSGWLLFKGVRGASEFTQDVCCWLNSVKSSCPIVHVRRIARVLEKTGKIQAQFLVTVSWLWPHTTVYAAAMVSCGVGIHQM